MKSYLSLVPISAKVHRRQNRMTLLCIILAVFLVTAVFSMADMGVTMEQARLSEKHGSLTIQDMVQNPMVQSLFSAAAVLFVLILIAGILMISSSINTNVAQRTRFFGMMRCIGMSKKQIIRFVRLEALSWCKTAVPMGVVLGIVFTWGLCAVLRFLVGEEFTEMPLFGISLIGIISGILAGILTVLLAAGSPARRAAKVSPITAVSENAVNTKTTRYMANTHSHNILKIETTLGVHHAVSAKKNLVLMTGSFALSIILFLGFLVLVDFIGYLIPQSSSTPDFTISSNGNTDSIDSKLLGTINGMAGVKRTFGRRSRMDIPAKSEKGNVGPGSVDVISYGGFELKCLSKDDMLKKGSDISKVSKNSKYVLATWDKDSPLKIGDKIRMGNEELEIAGLLKYDPFSSDGLTHGRITLITSGDTFIRLTGITDYSLLMVQATNDITAGDITKIRDLMHSNWTFRDKRDQRTAGIYTAFVFCVYGFLAIITLVTVLNIINSISMSASARIRQYGAMRAVGMDGRQVTKMIVAEAFTYAAAGCIVGCILGLLVHKWLYDILILPHYGYATWNIPIIPLLGILLFVLATVIAASYAPSKRIRNISVIETINEM